MRDEDLKKLPQSIERWRFAEMMHNLGFGPGFQNNLRELSVDYTGVHAVVYATDEQGRKYLVHSPEAIPVQGSGDAEPTFITGSSGREAAVHEISIPFSGSWEKPGDEAETDELREAFYVETAAVALWQSSCLDAARDNGEEVGVEDWSGDWLSLLTDGERETYRDRGRQMLKRLGVG